MFQSGIMLWLKSKVNRNVPSASFLTLPVECLMPQCYMLPISTLLLVVGKVCVKGFSMSLLSPLPYLLPAPTEQSLIARLRSVQKYPRVYKRTRCYCSFTNYSLNNYQDKVTNRIQSPPCSLSYPTFYPFLYTTIVTFCVCSLCYHNMITADWC